MIPHITIYTYKLPANVGGRATGPVVRIKPQYRDDKGIHAHELVHVAQWYTGLAIGLAVAGLMYFNQIDGWPLAIILGAMLHPLATASKSYTLWKEVKAYREQAKHYPDDRRLLFASFIAANYGLNISAEDAYQLLMKD
jgi:hypothetical protein